MMVGNIFDAIQGIFLENSRLLEKIFHKASLLKLAFVLRFPSRKHMKPRWATNGKIFNNISFCFYVQD